ncbi:MAG TPA: metallophosphoesterase family protein [Pirellulales bacterium]|jgi:diadenosine tetraphosphatase ApaH/serine/threonine PP2A family protein phosphatase|nr:metallophosphoesterase family protein [Pirellulales bacterium]
MKRALVADIHANLEAFEAVLDDIARQRITETYCLGDIVGFGPDPVRCIDLAMGLTCCLLGNHDRAAVDGPGETLPADDTSAQQTMWLLDQQARDPSDLVRRRDFLASLPLERRQGGHLFVHGSPRNQLREYIFPEDSFNPRKMTLIFQGIEHHCFHGHTHIPGVMTEGLAFHHPKDIGYEYRLGEEKMLINVGSVGQPRDGDPRACYVVLEDERVRFRRVEYPFDETLRKLDDLA